MYEEQTRIAKANFTALYNNTYPGRGIIAGVDETGEFIIQVYWIMGRGEQSRNRLFMQDEETGRLYTVAADPAIVKDPSLIIYNAMREKPPYYIVSNGDQTDTAIENLAYPFSLNVMLDARGYEPDESHTPRITAMSKLHLGRTVLTTLSILRKSPFGNRCERNEYLLDPGHGFGYCITTYQGDGNPLPSFKGDPLLMPLNGNRQEIAEAYWAVLDRDNRVAIAVKSIEIGNGRSDIHIINKNSPVG